MDEGILRNYFRSSRISFFCPFFGCVPSFCFFFEVDFDFDPKSFWEEEETKDKGGLPSKLGREGRKKQNKTLYFIESEKPCLSAL